MSQYGIGGANFAQITQEVEELRKEMIADPHNPVLQVAYFDRQRAQHAARLKRLQKMPTMSDIDQGGADQPLYERIATPQTKPDPWSLFDALKKPTNTLF